ncbi:MAG: hypothetical protein HY868_09430 [Chloroflexi bacterium]|nr:hypothetical protein [Chloroflexota bacterium]
MPDWIVILPVLVPPVIAPAFAMITRHYQAARPGLAIVLLALALAAVGLNIAPGTHRWVVADWQAASFVLAFRADGIVIALWFTMLIPLLALWLAAPPRAPFDPTRTLVLSAALLLTAADNLLSMWFAWSLLDLAIFAWRLAHDAERESAARGLVIGMFAGVGLFSGALLLGTPRAQDGARLLAVAWWARLALFPFQPLLPRRGADAADFWFARALPILAASALWSRAGDWVNAASDWLVLLAILAWLVALIWIWREEDPVRAVTVSASHAVALVPLAMAFGGDAGPAFVWWLAASFAFAFAFFELALRWRAENRNRWARLSWFAGVVTLLAPPLSPAFLGRVGVYISLWEAGQGLALLLVGAATSLLIAPLWNFAFAVRGAEERAPHRHESAALIILALTFSALTFAPLPIVQALGETMRDASEAAMVRVIWTNNAIGVISSFVILFVPMIVSFFLSDIVRGWHLRVNSRWMRLARVFDLYWLERITLRGGTQIGTLARRVSIIAEENPTVWLLLAGLWVAILILVLR